MKDVTPPVSPRSMTEMSVCPKCNRRGMSYDLRCRHFLCLYFDCAYSIKPSRDVTPPCPTSGDRAGTPTTDAPTC